MPNFERKLLKEIIEHLPEKEFTIISGARQTGKTTLLNQLAEKLKQNNEAVTVLTLEDQSILSRLNQHPENLFEFAIRPEGKRLYVLLDEIQYLNNPSNFLKLLYDKHHQSLKIVATGSSAFYIDRKFTDSLAGRKRLFVLYTLAFDEFLTFRTGNDSLKDELTAIRTRNNYLSPKRSELETYFNEYLIYGGYPAVALADSVNRKTQMLNEITSSYLKRDVIESNVQDQEKFYYLTLLLAQQTGSLVNVNELSKTLRLSTTAVENYLYILRKCFHLHLLRPWFRNIRKELVKMPKIYFHDLGFRNALIKQFNPIEQRPDKGMLIENYAYIRLREIWGNDTLHYWRTADGQEIDFIILNSFDEGIAMEIKFDEAGVNPMKYSRFQEAYPSFQLTHKAFKAANNEHSLMAF